MTTADEGKKRRPELVGDDPTGEVDISSVPASRPKPRLELASEPPGSLPPGSLPPGSLPPGSLPPGSLPPGSLAPAPVPAEARRAPSDLENERAAIAADRAPPPTSTVHNRVATSVLAGRIPFGSREQGMIRSLARTIGATGLVSISIGALVIAQWAMGRVSVPGVVAAVLCFALGLWSLLAAFHFQRVVATDDEDAHQLTAAFGNLRSIFILKAVGLFLVLALGCFAFSIVASLLALL